MMTRWLRNLIVCMFAAACAAHGQEAVGVSGANAPSPKIEVVTQTDAAHAGTALRVAVSVALGAGWHVNAHEPKDPYLIPTNLKLDPPQGQNVVVGEVAYPEPVSIVLAGAGEPMSVYGDSFVIGVRLDIGPDVAPGDYSLQGVLEYQACDQKRCLPPNTIAVTVPFKVVPPSTPLTAQQAGLFAKIQFGQSQPDQPAPVAPVPVATAPGQAPDWQSSAPRFTVTGSAAGYMKPAEFLSFLEQPASGQGAKAKSPLQDKSIMVAIILVIVGGLLLNLTPCVLPLIPINLAIIGAGAKAGSKLRGAMLGATYGGGIALAYGALGAVVVLGVSSAFGTLNSTPWFNGGIAVLFVVLALAMFDVFTIDLTRFQTLFGLQKRQGGGFVTAFLMGIVSALLAGACVAPAVIATLIYAQDHYAKGHWAAVLLPFLLGIGMALPWPVAGAGLSMLPKPGKWMERVKYAIGVFILLFAAWYGYLGWYLFNDRYLVDKRAVEQSASALDKEGWTSSLADGLALAEKENKPAVLDFWATWCKNCLVMNDTTLKDPQVVKRLEGFVKIKVQTENPNDPATKEIIQHFGVIGWPTYVTLAPQKK